VVRRSLPCDVEVDNTGERRAGLSRNSVEGFGPLQMRYGIHTGSVIAGVIGKRKFSYDLCWTLHYRVVIRSGKRALRQPRVTLDQQRGPETSPSERHRLLRPLPLQESQQHARRNSNPQPSDP
jgi:hypothetical protein